jgi:KaiC/GvpD/RAD55 family RecA-like ATPase
VIQFPETVQQEIDDVDAATNAAEDFRAKLKHDIEVQNTLEKERVRHEAKIKLQQEIDAEMTPDLEMTTLATYQLQPAMAPADLIDGVLKENGVCIVLGPSGSGKSTLALQMWNSLMSGSDFLGKSATALTGSVGIVSYDMDAPMVLDWMAGFPQIDADKVSIVNAYKRGNPLGVPAMRAQIAQAWQKIGVEIVMIDSFSASFFAHDQNDAALTMNHYRDLIMFALTEVGARAVVIIVHSTEDKPGKARGSSVHHDVADSIVGVEVLQSGHRKLQLVKYRAARGQKQMEPVIIGEPDIQTHLVDLDPSAMTLAGLHLPTGFAASAFPDLPDQVTTDTDDTDSTDDYEDGDDL